MCPPLSHSVGASLLMIFRPPHMPPVGGRLTHFKHQWVKTLRLSPWHIPALDGYPSKGSKHPDNRTFDSVLRYNSSYKQRVASSKTVQHYLATII